MPEPIRLLLFDYTVRTVALGAAVLGIVSGVLGCYAVLRRQSLFGDALAHAALPGVCIAFLLSGGKAPVLLLAGAAVSGWLGALAVLGIIRGSRVKEDAALGTVLTVFFGLGIVLLTAIQNTGNASQSGLNHFLFGQAAVLLQRDVVLMAALGAMALGMVALVYKEFKLLAFDPEFGSSLGFPMGRLSVLLTGLITVAVVIGLQTVGVVLMAALLVAPAAAARQWTDHLGRMILLSAVFGAASGVTGAVLSSLDARVPTGPLIVLLATAIVAVSVLFSPRRGVVWSEVRRWRINRRLATQRLLADMATLPGGESAFGAHALAGSLGIADAEALSRLGALERHGVVQRQDADSWRITSEGADRITEADRDRRAWRSELAEQLHMSEQDVHLESVEIARVLPVDVLETLDGTTDRHTTGDGLRVPEGGQGS